MMERLIQSLGLLLTWVGGSAPQHCPTTGYAVIVLWQINAVLYGLHTGDA